jgi:hypothetical protein
MFFRFVYHFTNNPLLKFMKHFAMWVSNKEDQNNRTAFRECLRQEMCWDSDSFNMLGAHFRRNTTLIAMHVFKKIVKGKWCI